MPKDLTEAATFDPTITVPLGTDSRANAAEVVEAIAQHLANRSRFLKAVTDVAAQKNAINTFTAQNTFNGTVQANGGISAADGSVELTGVLKVSGQLDVGGDLWVHTPHVWLEEGVDIVYSTVAPHAQPQRLVQLDISRARIVSGNPSWDDVGGFWYTTVAAGAAAFEVPIILPRNTAQWSFQILWSADGVHGTPTAEVWRYTRDYSAVGYAAQSDGESIGDASLLDYTTTVGEGFVTAGPVISDEVDPASSRLAVIVHLPAGDNYNRFYGLRLQFWDPGARNG